jgi:ankyrin repeat protein
MTPPPPTHTHTHTNTTHRTEIRFRGNASCIENYLEDVEGADLNATDDGCGSAPLHLAAAAGHADCVAALVQADGIDLGALDRNGRAPLILAASAGHLGVCIKLLEAGAPFSVAAADGSNCCHLAFGTVAASAEAEGLDAAAVLRAVGECAGDAATTFFSTAKNSQGKTVVHLAAAKHDVRALRYLSSVGVDMSTPDNAGLGPVYHLLPDEDGRECLRLLLGCSRGENDDDNDDGDADDDQVKGGSDNDDEDGDDDDTSTSFATPMHTGSDGGADEGDESDERDEVVGGEVDEH